MRLFVGLTMSEDVVRVLAGTQGGVPGAHWVTPESLHLTLRFIGEVDGAQAAEIDAALAAISAPAFTLSVSGVGQFGSGRHLRALWAAVTPAEPVAFLAAKVEAALVQAGIEPEGRKFIPHITLARLKHAAEGRVAHWLETNAALHAGPMAVDSFVLYRSHLGKEAAHYEVLAEYPLGA